MTHDEARALLANRDATLAPPDARFLVRWIGPLNAVVRNPQPPGDLKAWADAMVFACERIPAAAFTPVALRGLMASCQFFPSAAEVIDAVSHNAETIRHRVRTAESMCAIPTNAAALRLEDDRKRREIAGRMVDLAEALKANSAPALTHAATVRPGAVGDDVLRQFWERMARSGNQAARLRLEAMNAKG